MSNQINIELRCPVCSGKLRISEKVCRCRNNHCYDIAKSGYINLLNSSSKGHHGDDKLMVRARNEFLNKGYYDRLSDLLCNIVFDDAEDSLIIIDAGCGEGKYTSDLKRKLDNSGILSSIIGVDISKEAVMVLSKRKESIIPVVASTADLPVFDNTADVLLNVFAPFFREEFLRVLKKNGKLIRVVPLEEHLIELKSIIYDNPYLNDVPSYEEDGMQIVQKIPLRYKIQINSTEDLNHLFMMTPYYYKTGEKDQAKLEALDCLEISLEFLCIVYKKM